MSAINYRESCSNCSRLGVKYSCYCEKVFYCCRGCKNSHWEVHNNEKCMKIKQEINKKREELYLKLFGNLYIKFDKFKKILF